MNSRLASLATAGVSIWLDDLSRHRISSGNLAGLIENDSVTGVTTNPTIFAGALTGSADYTDQLKELGPVSPAEVIKTLWATDVRNACDMFAGIYQATKGYDGRVSIEVEPGLARDTQGTVAQAAELAALVGRENVLIKIPATVEGLPAITQTIGAGISVNVTLIFSENRYRDVMDAYMEGLEVAAAAGKDLSTIHSVASFFISRVDSEIDHRLNVVGTDEAKALKGKAGIANALIALAAYDEVFGGERFQALKAKGANLQRPLWASTGTKDPSYPDTLYISGLIAQNVVNTIPEKTMQAFGDHGELGTPMEGRGAEGKELMNALDAVGLDLTDVFEVLEDEGLSKFDVSWAELVESVKKAQDAVK